MAPAESDHLVADGAPSAGFTSAAARIAPPATNTRQALGGSASRRSASAARRAPIISVNYHYLGRDLRSLAVLAPTMVVLLVIAFFVFH